MVHGSMDRSATFAGLLPHLADWAVRRYDRRGYGRSIDAGVCDLKGHADDIVSVLAGVPAVVVGHSIGGVMVLLAGVRRPDVVRAIVAYEAPMQWEDWWPPRSAGGDAMTAADAPGGGPAAVAERFFRNMVGDERWESLPAATKAARCAEGPALVAELHAARTHAPYEPAEVKVPVVAAYGSASKPYHQRAARELAALAPDAELVEIEGARHDAHQSHPEEFAGLVRRAHARA